VELLPQSILRMAVAGITVPLVCESYQSLAPQKSKAARNSEPPVENGVKRHLPAALAPGRSAYSGVK